MAIARNLKFGVHIDHDEYYSIMEKLGDKEAWPESCDLLFNFATHSISKEQLTLET